LPLEKDAGDKMLHSFEFVSQVAISNVLQESSLSLMINTEGSLYNSLSVSLQIFLDFVIFLLINIVFQ